MVCFGCEERSAECRKTCPKWAEYEKAYFENRKKKEERYKERNDYESYKNDAMKRMQRNRK